MTKQAFTDLDKANEFILATKDFLLSSYGTKGEKIYEAGVLIDCRYTRAGFYKDVLLDIRKGPSEEGGLFPTLKNKAQYHRTPVDIETFILDPYYLNLGDQIYPEILKEIKKMATGEFVEVVLTGAIGTAKTTIALWLTTYQVYLLSCMRKPQATFSIAYTDEILIIFQSITAQLARVLDYARFRALVESCEYFKKNFPFDKEIESELRFPNRIIVRPVAGVDTAAIGQNVIGGVIDELNYMAVVESSKQSIDGGTYDQAITVYNSIARRRKSRFMKKGKMPGILCLVSSKRYPGQFTDLKMEEAEKEIEKNGKTTIYIYDKVTWDILPPDRFTGEWFRMFVGDEFTQPYILEEGMYPPEGKEELVMDIPMEYYTEFEGDPMNSLREIAGVSTLAKHPYMANTSAVSSCFDEEKQSILSGTVVDFTTIKLQLYPKRFSNPELPRWVHIDLAVTGDSAGVAIGHVPKFVKVDKGDDIPEVLPYINIDCTLEVAPPKGGEILFYKIRNLLYKLKQHGLNIKWVSFDSYQSTDSIQMLRHKGFITGRQSMDINSIPYDVTKTALYDGRVWMPEHTKLRKELTSLEQDTKTAKIDHPANSSKDVSDALAGVVYGLTMRKEVWAKHGVSAAQAHSITNIGDMPQAGEI